MPIQPGDSQPVRFPAFRSYLAAREMINDELMALVVGAGIAAEALVSAPDETLLPELRPDVPDVQRMNQPIADVRALWGRASPTIARTAIPYILSVYGVFLADAVGLLHEVGLDADQHEPDDTYVSKLHDRLAAATGVELPTRDLALYEVIRVVRNRLVHQAGTPGSKLRSLWSRLSPDAKTEWIRVAGRPLTESIVAPQTPLDLGLGELHATLAVTHRLAHRVSAGLIVSVAPEVWADILVADYQELWPRRYGNRTQRLRRLKGYARHSYGALNLTDLSIEEAIRRVDVL